MLQPELLIVADDGRDRGYPGGLSLGDVDGDGDLDLLATRGYDVTSNPYREDRSLLYLNKGDGTFTRSEQPFADEEAADSGATLADIDGDGDLDAYVNVQHRKPNRFFRNEGGGRFVAQQLGEATADQSSDFSSAFVDIDGDGDLDLYVTGPTLELAASNLVFRNDDGHFVAVTGAPIDNGKRNPAAALWGDVDNDGDPDLLVANSDVMRLSNYPPPDVEHALLYRNEGNWTFTVTSGQAFAAAGYPVISAAPGDIDNDGDLDLFLGSHVYKVDPRPDWLFVNDGQGTFSLSPQAFPTHAQTATGAVFADFNGDGNLDLIATSYEGPIGLFTGDGRGSFTAVADPALAEVRKGRWAAVTGDIDGDGRIDALLGSWGETKEGDYITILRNRTPRCGSWAELLLSDGKSAPNPPGARVTFTTVGKGQTAESAARIERAVGLSQPERELLPVRHSAGAQLPVCRRALARWPHLPGEEYRAQRHDERDCARAALTSDRSAVAHRFQTLPHQGDDQVRHLGGRGTFGPRFRGRIEAVMQEAHRDLQLPGTQPRRQCPGQRFEIGDDLGLQPLPLVAEVRLGSRLHEQQPDDRRIASDLVKEGFDRAAESFRRRVRTSQ
ncbi:MAG: VCBS repeat-containing protein [Gammaproteobacteria bacterium]|nr:VCBS repeat-containing protein [Gammaproteobacteria bacterium]